MKRFRVISKFRFFITLSVIASILVLSTFSLAVNAKNDTDELLVCAYVKPGDTLWTLSLSYNNDNIDTREYIQKVMKINNLRSANIKPGDIIYFPVNNK